MNSMTYLNEKKKPEEEFNDYYQDESMKQSENNSPQEPVQKHSKSPRQVAEDMKSPRK